MPLVIAALVLPVAVGFLVAGPALGLAVGAAVAISLIVVAARMLPNERIEAVAASDGRRRLLVAISRELDDPEAIERLAQSERLRSTEGGAEILVLAPARAGVLQRWATDYRHARDEAQRQLVITAASLGKANLPVRAHVGDADLVQAIEDELRTYAANELVLVTGPPQSDRDGERVAAALEARLALPFSRVVVEPGLPR